MEKSQLALALSKAQGEMKPAKKDSANPFFKSKYSDLASVWEACREALSNNEIAVIQVPELRDGIIGIRTKLAHSSGEFEEGFFPLAVPPTAKAQEMGSAMTYLRRYALSAMVGVAPEDDDGNSATQSSGQKVKFDPPITQDQAMVIQDYLDNTDSDVPAFLKMAKAESVSDIRAADYDRLIKLLEKKAAKNV